MSEALTFPTLKSETTKRVPTVYFIDDSATMREVIKIAFRRENMNVITCGDAASAIAQFENSRPDIVITDVIMPDQDGYSVCTQVKQHAEFSKVPVVLMSGVVNKSVADKAMAVQADELIRKPFQPQELIARVRSLLSLPEEKAVVNAPRGNALTALFSPVAAPPLATVPMASAPALPAATLSSPANTASTETIWPRALAEAFTPASAAMAGNHSPAHSVPNTKTASQSAEGNKLRGEIARIELLVKKLQAELQLERDYSRALEQQVRALMSAE